MSQQTKKLIRRTYTAWKPRPWDSLDEAMDKLLKTQHRLLNSSRYQLKKGCTAKFIEAGLGPVMDLNPTVMVVNGRQAVFFCADDWTEFLHSEDFVMSFFDDSSAVIPEAMSFKDFHICFEGRRRNIASAADDDGYESSSFSNNKMVSIKCRTMEVSLGYEPMRTLFEVKDMVNLKMELLSSQRFGEYIADVCMLIKTSPNARDFQRRIVLDRPNDINKLTLLEYFEFYRNGNLFSKFQNSATSSSSGVNNDNSQAIV